MKNSLRAGIAFLKRLLFMSQLVGRFSSCPCINVTVAPNEQHALKDSSMIIAPSPKDRSMAI